MMAERETTHSPEGPPSRAGSWPVIGALTALLAVLQALPPQWRSLLRYERDAVSDGEWWRLLSGHLVHLGWAHFALNAAGLALILWIFGPDRPARTWSIAAVLAALSTGIGVWLASPATGWMVGLSGLLHGLFVFGAAAWIGQGRRAGWVLLAAVAAKIAYEQFTGGDTLTAGYIGGDVVVDAHLWGAAGGLLATLLVDRPWQDWSGRGSPL